jgi:L-lactate dehydrogenase complex protein LldG
MHSGKRINPFVNRGELKTGGRAPFMERVRRGLGHLEGASPVAEEPPVRDEEVVRQVAVTDEGRIDRWIEKARGNSMVVHRISGDAAAVAAGIDLCFAKHAIRKSVLNAQELAAQFGIEAYLAEKKIDMVRWGEPGCREAAFECEASITDCRAGLADTGAILVWSDDGFGRSSTLVVPVHVVLLPVSRILPDLIDGLALAHAQTAGRAGGDGRLPSNIVVINGPSKTADIEMNLVTGVHGPKFLYVLVVDGI